MASCPPLPITTSTALPCAHPLSAACRALVSVAVFSSLEGSPPEIVRSACTCVHTAGKVGSATVPRPSPVAICALAAMHTSTAAALNSSSSLEVAEWIR